MLGWPDKGGVKWIVKGGSGPGPGAGVWLVKRWLMILGDWLEGAGLKRWGLLAEALGNERVDGRKAENGLSLGVNCSVKGQDFEKEKE